MKRRNLILLLGGASSGAMSVGTGAFSSMEAERGVSVSVEDDEDAYVGYRSSDKEISSDEEIDLVKIRNQFGDDTEIRIIDVETEVETLEGDGPTLNGDPTFPEKSFGQWDGSQIIKGEASCGDKPGKSRFEVTVLVRGKGVQAKLFGETETRSFIVKCDPPTESDPPTETLTVEFKGGGNVFVSSDEPNLNTEVLYLEEDETRIEPSSGAFEWDTSKNLDNGRPEKEYDPSGKLVAVGFINRDETYYNPKYNIEEISFPDGWTASTENSIKGDKRGGGPPN